EQSFAVSPDGTVTGYRPEGGLWHTYDWPGNGASGTYTPEPNFMIEGPEVSTFHDDGSLASATAFGDAPETFDYDAAGRLETVNRADGVVSIAYSGPDIGTITDTTGGTLTFGYAKGVIHSVTRAGAETGGAPVSIAWERGADLNLTTES